MLPKLSFSLSTLSLSVLFLTGCSSTGSGLADEICDAPGVLTEMDGDPNIQSGADLWMKYYNKANELKSSANATAEELAIANAMNQWFTVATEMDQLDLGWGSYGQEFSDAGMKLIQACAPYLED